MNLRNTGFVRFIYFQKKFSFSHEHSLLKTGHSPLSEAESQNPKMKMAAGKGGPWKEKNSLNEETLTPLKNPSSSKNQIDPGKILILDFGVVGRG